MKNSRILSSLVFLLLNCAPVGAESVDPLPLWGGARVSLGTGLSIFPYATGDPGSLERQMGEVGLEMPVFGGIFDLSIECELMGWLVFGAEFDYQIHSGETAEGFNSHINLDPELSPGLSYDFHRLVGLGFVQGNVIGRHSGKDFEMGIRLALGGGGLIWNMRGAKETGRILEFRPSLVIGGILGDWTLHGHIAFPMQWIWDVGPYDLDYTGLTGAIIELKVGYRL